MSLQTLNNHFPYFVDGTQSLQCESVLVGGEHVSFRVASRKVGIGQKFAWPFGSAGCFPHFVGWYVSEPPQFSLQFAAEGAVEFRFSTCLQTPSAISEALLAAVLGNHLDQGLEQGNLEEYMGLIHHEQLDLDSPRWNRQIDWTPKEQMYLITRAKPIIYARCEHHCGSNAACPALGSYREPWISAFTLREIKQWSCLSTSLWICATQKITGWYAFFMKHCIHPYLQAYGDQLLPQCYC